MNKKKKSTVEILFRNEELLTLMFNLSDSEIQQISCDFTLEDGYDGMLTVRGPLSKIEEALFRHNKEDEVFQRIAANDSDKVLRPAYYHQDDPYEVIKVIRAWELGFEDGNALKYIARAGKKDPKKEIEDREKAITYLQMKNEDAKSKLNGD